MKTNPFLKQWKLSIWLSTHFPRVTIRDKMIARNEKKLYNPCMPINIYATDTQEQIAEKITKTILDKWPFRRHHQNG